MLEPRPVSASINITRRCNSKCSFCGIWRAHDSTQPDTAELLEIVNDLTAELGLSLVSLTGGEPFIRDDILDVIGRIRSNGVPVSVATNGTLITGKIASRLAEMGSVSLVFSIDTVHEETYSALRGIPLEMVMRGLDAALDNVDMEKQFNASINCVVCRQNLDDLENLVSFASEKRITVGFQPCHGFLADEWRVPEENLFTLEDTDRLEVALGRLMEMKRNGAPINNNLEYLESFPQFLAFGGIQKGVACRTGSQVVTIDAALNLRPCWQMEPVGNLRDQKLSELWMSEAFVKTRKQMERGKCPGCWLRCYFDSRG